MSNNNFINNLRQNNKNDNFYYMSTGGMVCLVLKWRMGNGLKQGRWYWSSYHCCCYVFVTTTTIIIILWLLPPHYLSLTRTKTHSFVLDVLTTQRTGQILWGRQSFLYLYILGRVQDSKLAFRNKSCVKGM